MSAFYSVEQEGMAGRRLPIERLDEGLYIHPGSASLATISTFEESPEGARSERTDFYVLAHDFMLMQRERDELRRTLALLNVAIRRGGSRIRMLNLLTGAGFTPEQARATQQIIQEFGGSE